MSPFLLHDNIHCLLLVFGKMGTGEDLARENAPAFACASWITGEATGRAACEGFSQNCHRLERARNQRAPSMCYTTERVTIESPSPCQFHDGLLVDTRDIDPPVQLNLNASPEPTFSK